MSAAVGMSADSRCAIHPARPAVGPCPHCTRNRCAADAAAFDQRCGACGMPPAEGADHRRTTQERLVRAGLAVYPLVLLGGWISTQYWHDRFFSLIVPGLVGLGCAAVATAAGGRGVGTIVAIPAGLLAVALSYALVPGGAGLLAPPGQELPPYVAALVGVAAWPVLFGPAGHPQRRRKPALSGGSRPRR